MHCVCHSGTRLLYASLKQHRSSQALSSICSTSDAHSPCAENRKAKTFSWPPPVANSLPIQTQASASSGALLGVACGAAGRSRAEPAIRGHRRGCTSSSLSWRRPRARRKSLPRLAPALRLPVLRPWPVARVAAGTAVGEDGLHASAAASALRRL
jgi:hypothetical protein